MVCNPVNEIFDACARVEPDGLAEVSFAARPAPARPRFARSWKAVRVATPENLVVTSPSGRVQAETAGASRLRQTMVLRFPARRPDGGGDD